jgi:hypothetical protein
MSRRVLALATAALALLGAPGRADGLRGRLGLDSAVVEARLERHGSVVLDRATRASDDGSVIAYVLFRQPVARVLALLTDGARQMEWRPDLASVSTLERSERERLDEVQMRVLFTSLTYRVRYRLDATRITWTLDPRFDNDLRRFEGFWELEEVSPERTLGRFGTQVDAGQALPAAMQRRLTRRSVERTMESCRRWVDAAGAVE